MDRKKVNENYTKLTGRLLEMAMFHEQAMNMYNFFGLNGFKRMHEYFYECNLKCFKKIKMHYVTRHNGIIVNSQIETPEVFPKEWANHKQSDLTNETAINLIKKIFEKAKTEEEQSKAFYSELSKEFLSAGATEDVETIEKLFTHLYQEMKCMDRLSLNMKKTEFNFDYILSVQLHLHEKYKKLTRKL